jgi:hypothetical protein
VLMAGKIIRRGLHDQPAWVGLNHLTRRSGYGEYNNMGG